MKIKPGNCCKRFRFSKSGCFKFSLTVLCSLFALGVALAQNQASKPPADTDRARELEAKYQAAIKDGDKAQAQHFYLTAQMYYQQALKLKPGDETAAKLESDMRAKVAERISRAKSGGTATAPPAGQPQPGVANQSVASPATQAQPSPPPVGATIEAASGGTTNQISDELLKSPPKNKVSVSGDFLYGQGHVTVPLLFSLQRIPALSGISPAVASGPRNSDYAGATLSYSRGQSWFLDLSYAHGTSSGDTSIPGQKFNMGTANNTAFSIDDNSYQLFVRYVPKRLLITDYYAYLRAGVSYVNTTLLDSWTTPPPVNQYNQTDQTTDILGNAGFGVGYFLPRRYLPSSWRDRLRVSLQVEAEGFYGHRSQEVQESLPLYDPVITGPVVSISNELYGGYGRATVRFQWALGKSGLLKAFSDIGVGAKYTIINYSASANYAGGSYNELLWGPYVKVGLRWDF
jgi:hypothetical protein